MSDKQQFDVLIIGSGEAGKNLAWTMAKTGRRTAVVERKLIGGSCPNIACLPSKNVILREDARTYGTPTWIWSVVVDGALYVRAYKGKKSRWHQAALQQKAGRITAAGITKEVSFEFRRGDLLVRVGVKGTADPIHVCYCFGFTRKDIEDEIAETGRSTVADRITVEARAGRCACEVKNPSGKCCLGSIEQVVKDYVRANQRAKVESEL